MVPPFFFCIRHIMRLVICYGKRSRRLRLLSYSNRRENIHFPSGSWLTVQDFSVYPVGIFLWQRSLTVPGTFGSVRRPPSKRRLFPHAVRRIAVAAQALLLAQSVIPIGMDVPISICGRAPDIHYVFSARSIPSLLRRPTPVFQCSYAESLRPSAKDDLFCIIPFCQEHNEFGQYISLCFSSYTVYAPIILSASSPNACFLSPS